MDKEIKNEATDTPVIVDETTDEAAEEKKDTKITQEELQEEMVNNAFEYGDLKIICRKCGHEQTIDTKVKGGIQVTLLTNRQSFLDLKCDKCDSHMVFKMVECEPPSDEEIAEMEAKKKEAQEEMLKKAEEAQKAREAEAAKVEAEELEITVEEGGETIEKKVTTADENVQEENVEGESV